MNAHRFRRSALIPIVTVLMLLANGLSVHLTHAQQVVGPLPEVISAADPTYPQIGLAAHISGVVHLHLTTDGKRVSTITEQTGPALLIPFAEAYVRTWIFAEHTPTTFNVTIRYNYQEKSECETGIKINPAILHLPTEVEINAAGYCDSVRFFRNKKILAEQHAYAVELHFVINDRNVEAPSEVVVTNRINKNTFHSVPLPVKDGLLLVPEEMVNGSQLELQARIGQDQIDIPGISQYDLGKSWKIILIDRRIKGDNYSFYVPRTWNIRSSCLVEFEPLEGLGINMAVSHCRMPIRK